MFMDSSLEGTICMVVLFVIVCRSTSDVVLENPPFRIKTVVTTSISSSNRGPPPTPSRQRAARESRRPSWPSSPPQSRA